MSKKANNPFDKLNETEPVKTPVQKVVPVEEKEQKINKRDNEKPYTLYLHKDIIKDLKQLSLDRNTNVKEIVQKAILEYLKKQK